MADAAKSNEIEDVLSSIRRLVSEHQPPERDRPSEPATPVAPAATDALILTPALRVTDPEDPWLPITPREETAEAAAPDGAQPGREDGADWARELWAEDDGAPAETLDPQLQADQWEATGTAADEEAPETVAEAEDAALDTLDVTEAVLQQAALQDEADRQDEADTDAGEGEDDLPDVPLSFIRSGSASLTDYEPEEGDRDLAEEDLPAAMRDLAQSRAAQRAHEDETPSGSARVKVAILRAPVEEDEASGSETGAHEEQTEATQNAEGPDPQDEAPTDFLAAEAGGEDVEDLGESPFAFPDEGDSFVDEAALRDLIAEVVREELQGEMGVRITRNIRKLVRREIRLALAAQDLD